MLVSLFFQIEIMLFKIHSPLSLANTQSDKHKTTLYSAYTLVYKHFEKSISPLTFFWFQPEPFQSIDLIQNFRLISYMFNTFCSVMDRMGEMYSHFRVDNREFQSNFLQINSVFCPTIKSTTFLLNLL